MTTRVARYKHIVWKLPNVSAFVGKTTPMQDHRAKSFKEMIKDNGVFNFLFIASVVVHNNSNQTILTFGFAK